MNEEDIYRSYINYNVNFGKVHKTLKNDMSYRPLELGGHKLFDSRVNRTICDKEQLCEDMSYAPMELNRNLLFVSKSKLNDSHINYDECPISEQEAFPTSQNNDEVQNESENLDDESFQKPTYEQLQEKINKLEKEIKEQTAKNVNHCLDVMFNHLCSNKEHTLELKYVLKDEYGWNNREFCINWFYDPEKDSNWMNEDDENSITAKPLMIVLRHMAQEKFGWNEREFFINWFDIDLKYINYLDMNTEQFYKYMDSIMENLSFMERKKVIDRYVSYKIPHVAIIEEELEFNGGKKLNKDTIPYIYNGPNIEDHILFTTGGYDENYLFKRGTMVKLLMTQFDNFRFISQNLYEILPKKSPHKFFLIINNCKHTEYPDLNSKIVFMKKQIFEYLIRLHPNIRKRNIIAFHYGFEKTKDVVIIQVTDLIVENRSERIKLANRMIEFNGNNFRKFSRREQKFQTIFSGAIELFPIMTKKSMNRHYKDLNPDVNSDVVYGLTNSFSRDENVVKFSKELLDKWEKEKQESNELIDEDEDIGNIFEEDTSEDVIIEPLTKLPNKEVVEQENETPEKKYTKGSSGEKAVRAILNVFEIKFKEQKAFAGLVSDSDHDLRFDFYFEYNDTKNIIEVDGAQHFQSVEFFESKRHGYVKGSTESFRKTRCHDFRKMDYCVEHSINLLRISDKNLDNLDWVINLFLHKVTTSNTTKIYYHSEDSYVEYISDYREHRKHMKDDQVVGNSKKNESEKIE